MVLVQKWPFSQLFFFRLDRPGKFLLRYSTTKKMSLQAIKRRSLKSRKIDIFVKGLTHGFGPKITFFPTFFFLVIQTRKMSFTIFQNEKMPFQAIKTRSLKRFKIDILLEWLTHGFSPKMAIFPTFYFQARQSRKISVANSRTKNAFLDYKNKTFKESKNRHFSKVVNPWFRSKKGHFSNFFFLSNIDQENVFSNNLERKNAFLSYKNKKLKKIKN